MITDACINCGACEPECPNNAIYEGGAEWTFADGTGLKGTGNHPSAGAINADATQEPGSMDVYYITTDKCTECVGHFDEPQCVQVCPVACIPVHPQHIESRETLMQKYLRLQATLETSAGPKP